MVGQPPQETPFGLEPNIAAGLAYLLGIIGGIVMLLGGGTNRFVKWAAAQSITLWVAYFVIWIVYGVLSSILSIANLGLLMLPLALVVAPLLGLLMLATWLYTSINAFGGKEVRLPFIADLTERFFGAQLGA